MENYCEYLNLELLKRSKKNKSFSQRAFAKMLELSPGEFSEILNGKRKLSVKKALRIAEKLSLSPEETLYFLSLAKDSKTNLDNKLNSSTAKLSEDVFEIVSNWYCFAIINLSECEGFSWDKEYIAKKLGITTAEARDALNRLKRIGLIIEDTTDQYRVVSDFVIGPDDIPNAAIRKSHHELLNKAIDSLEMCSHNERNITGIGIALNASEYQEVVRDIAAFRRNLVKKYGYTNTKKNKVYQLELALFEITTGNTDD